MRLSSQPLPAHASGILGFTGDSLVCLFKEPEEGKTKLIEHTVSGEMTSHGSVVPKLWGTAHFFFFLNLGRK